MEPDIEADTSKHNTIGLAWLQSIFSSISNCAFGSQDLWRPLFWLKTWVEVELPPDVESFEITCFSRRELENQKKIYHLYQYLLNLLVAFLFCFEEVVFDRVNLSNQTHFFFILLAGVLYSLTNHNKLYLLSERITCTRFSFTFQRFGIII